MGSVALLLECPLVILDVPGWHSVGLLLECPLSVLLSLLLVLSLLTNTLVFCPPRSGLNLFGSSIHIVIIVNILIYINYGTFPTLSHVQPVSSCLTSSHGILSCCLPLMSRGLVLARGAVVLGAHGVSVCMTI